jgi:hypothetical protein
LPLHVSHFTSYLAFITCCLVCTPTYCHVVTSHLYILFCTYCFTFMVVTLHLNLVASHSPPLVLCFPFKVLNVIPSPLLL